MNKHFEDTGYYLKRAGEMATRGVREELGPIQERVKRLVGREPEPEPGRIDRIRADLEALQGRVGGEARAAVENVRGRLRAYRA